MSSISVRSERALRSRPYYFSRMFEAMDDQWDQNNQDGFIMAAVAENCVSSSIILERLQANHETMAIPSSTLMYNDSTGWLQLRTAICNLLQRTTMATLTLAPENLVLSSGVSSILDNLFFILADDNATCLISAPYYPMFDQYLGNKSNVHAQPVHLNTGDDIQALEAAVRKAQAERKPVRALLLTSPDNPTGAIIPEARLKAMIRWCVKKRIHCVVDELYGLSIFPNEAPFVSAMVTGSDLAAEMSHKEAEKLWEHLHVVTGLSKDFCASGFRVGALYTYNADVIQAYHGVSAFAQISGMTQWQCCALLEDEPFIDDFMQQNAANLEGNCAILCEGLDNIGVPYVRPEAGFFVWMSLKETLSIDTYEREAALWNGVFDKAKIFLVPGETCHASEPGWYRVCFASHPAEAMHDMVARLKHFIDQYKVKHQNQSWSTQGFMLAAGFGTGR